MSSTYFKKKGKAEKLPVLRVRTTMGTMKTITFYLQHPLDSIECAELASRVRVRARTIRVRVRRPEQKPRDVRGKG
jgi:hypothetical protein